MRIAKPEVKWQMVRCHQHVFSTYAEIFGARSPYGFLERFDPNFTPNTSDLSGKRYTFRNQPEMGQWNLAQLANALIKGDLLNVVRARLLPVRPSMLVAVNYQRGAFVA